MTQHQSSPHSLWLEAQREQLAQAALAAISPNASAEIKTQAILKLVATLEGLRQWDRWDRLQMPDLVRRQNYGIVDDISVRSKVMALQALPDGRIVSGGEGGTIHIWDGKEVQGDAS